MLDKPLEIVNRDKDWEILSRFLTPRPADMGPGASIAAVTGRRRAGKTYLLEQFSGQSGGLYYEARQEDDLLQAQRRLREAIAQYEPARAAEIEAMPIGEPDTWDRLLELAMNLTSARRTGGTVPPVIIDEFPYLLRDTPVFPSILHQLYDSHMLSPVPRPRGPGAGAAADAGGVRRVGRPADAHPGSGPLHRDRDLASAAGGSPGG
ncbi:hypothetical protein [Microbispora sp. NPDC049125]|uniref:hypothetical protein n=1 Tax=Microbispora sp. NPDC049125 TaxID=3154929 RepID=UPI003466A321